MSHFRNALCCRQHYHGVQKATCSIDTLAELYYYGVYPYDRQRNENGGSELFAALINLCRMRESYGSICEVRENLWNYLVHNVRGFSPKGTSSAEIIQAFDNFKDLSGKFLVEYHVRSNCSSCGHFCRLSIELDPVHYFDHGVNSSHPGSLHSGLEFIVDRAIRYKSRDMRCDQCYSSLASVTETEIKMPNFLLVQLPVDKQSKNMQNPHPVICESMSVKGTTYKLTGAVQVLPGHFYGVVKHRNEYWVLDDLKDMPLKFPSFAGAVIRQKNLHSTILHVNKGHDGVHILLYARDWKDASVIREARSLPPPQSKWQHSPPPTLFTPDSSCYDEDFPRMEKNESPMKKHSKRHKRTVFRQPDISTPKKVKRTGDVTGKGHVDSLKCSPARERGKTVNLQHSSNNTQLGTQRRRKIISVKNHKNVGEPLQEKKEEFDSKTENLTKPEEDAPHQTRQKSWEKSKASDGEPVLGEKADLDFEEENSSNVREDAPHQTRQRSWDKSKASDGEPVLGEKADLDFEEENSSNVREDAPHQTRQKYWDKSKTSDGEPVLGEKADLDFEEENSSNVREDAPHQTRQKSWDKSKASDGEPNLGEKADLDFEEENSSNVREDAPHQTTQKSWDKSKTSDGEPVLGEKADLDFEEENSSNVREDAPHQTRQKSWDKSKARDGEPNLGEKADLDFEQENSANMKEDAPHQTRQKSWDKSKASDGEPVLGEKADLDFEEENSSNVKEDAPHQTTQKSWDKSKASDGEPNLGEKADLDFEQENDSNVGNTLHEGKENTYEENQTTYGEPTPEENAGQNAGQGTPLNSEKGNTPDEKSKRFYASNVSHSIEKVVEKKLCDILGHSVVTTHFCGELYLSCDIFRIAGFNISKCGYTQFDKILDEYYHHENPAFLLLGTKRTWVFSDALITILRQKQKQRKAKRERIALVLHELMKMKSSQEQSHAHANKDVPNANQSSKTNESQEPTKTDEHDLTFRNVVKYFSLFGKQIPCYLYAERVWLDISEIFQYVGFSPNIKKRGWKYVDACLKTQGIDPQYAFDHLRNRRCMTIQGLEILLKKCKIGDKRQKMEVLEELRTEWDELASSRLQTLHLYKSEKSDMNTCKSSAEKSKEKSFRNKQGNVILCEEQWKNEKAVYDMYKSLHPVSGEDLVHLSDNFSGIRLMNQLRKAIPGILPSYAEEVEVKRQYKESFSCILSPQRTSTGWIIDPSRLLEVLSFKYPYIEDKLCIKLWGDGREIGGRHSTSLALSLLNHDLYLHNVLYQSPDHIYPFSIFYESDSRENLEENLAKYNVCEKLMRVCDASDIYLSGDEMFLIKILDGSSVLSPTSQKGWNFYHECAKEDKAQVAESGLRTDRPVLLDRKHPESLLPCIPLCNIVFDPMHGFTRIVEKLLILEVEKILYESNKNEQKTGTSSKTVLLENLTTNINNRGVRQGNFQIHFDKSGNPEPISLNKSHALSIVGIIRNDGSDDYPHVLHNVVPKRKLPLKTQEKIKEHFQHDLPCITEYDLAAQIYDTIFLMYNILKEEPGPILLDGKPEGSLRQQDYCWGYQEQTKLQYKALAERFYTLFCVRFTWQNFTPYMVKFVDYARYFMDYLHFPMNRFLTEGGEHINYIHSSYYFQHTTRHGGKYKVDPQLSFLIAMFRKLSYDIRQGEAAEEFTLYAKKHVSACKIQAFFRGYSVRKLLRERGWCPRPINENEVNRNESVLEDLHVHSGTFRTPLRELHENLPLFHGKTFILSGFVPSAHGKKWTQESLGEKIISLGGRVRKMLPGKTKGRSTKVYYLLVNTAGVKRSKKVPDIIYEAFIRRCILLDYKYIFDCLDSSCNLSTKEYEADFRDSLGHTSQQKPLHAIHFSRKKSVASLLRKKRMKKEGLKVLKKTCPVSPAVLYAHLKRREQIENTCTRIPFQEHGKLLKKYCEEFKGLPSAEKEHYRSLWNSRKRESIESNIEREKIKRYNKISSPLYKTLR